MAESRREDVVSSTQVDVSANLLPRRLTDHDRCDRCGSQAYVQVSLPTGQLLFCAHHFQEFEARLRRIATSVLDERDRLYAVSSPGSASSSTSP